MTKCLSASVVFTLGLLVLGLASSPAFAQQQDQGYTGSDWPHYLGPHRTSVTPEIGFIEDWGNQPPVVWHTDIGVGFASMAAVEDRVYAIGNTDGEHETIFCLDAETGAEIWSDTYPSDLVDNLHEGGPTATPTVYDGRLYILSRVGDVRCYDAETGEILWGFNVPHELNMDLPEWGFSSSIPIEDGVAYLQAGATIAFDAETGEMLWVSDWYEPSYTTPQPFNFRGYDLIATLNSHGLVILDAETGREVAQHRWRTQFDAGAPTPLIVGEGRIYVTTGYGTGNSLFRLTEDGRLLQEWQNRNIAAHMDTPVYHDGYIYGFDGNHSRPNIVDLVCIEAETGIEQWRYNDFGCGNVILAGDTLVILSDDGELAMAEATPRGFRGISRGWILDGRCWTAPILAHGRVFARNAAGDLVAVDLRP